LDTIENQKNPSLFGSATSGKKSHNDYNSKKNSVEEKKKAV
jgi:hypothetical protein